MAEITRGDLPESVRDVRAFGALDDYFKIGLAYLEYIALLKPMRLTKLSIPYSKRSVPSVIRLKILINLASVSVNCLRI